MTKATLRDVLIFIRFNHPDGEKLSHVRAVMTAYLADWRSALAYGEQVTDVEWTLDRIFVHTDFTHWRLTGESTGEQSPPDWAEISHLQRLPAETFRFSEDQRQALLFVIDVAQTREFSELAKLVASTYPVLTQESEDVPLNLVALAETYKHLATA